MRFFSILIIMMYTSFLYAGMAVYMVEDKDRRPISYRIYMNNTSGTFARASLYNMIKNKLIDKNDVEFIQLLKNNPKYRMINSGSIVSGYYVIIDNGSRFIEYPRYGIGFSEKSSSDAEKNARKNLSGNDWNWYYKKYGSKIIESNTFPESSCSKKFHKCLLKAKNIIDKKKCAMQKKKCQGPINSKPSNIFKSDLSSGVRG